MVNWMPERQTFEERCLNILKKFDTALSEKSNPSFRERKVFFSIRYCEIQGTGPVIRGNQPDE
jgi:hypothetical protein